MHRSVILDFLSIYRQQLNKYSFKQATISLLGRLNLKEISSLILRADEIVTYHVNEPRVYEKTYSFDVFSNTICDMVFYTKSEVFLTKNELSSVLDPYYLKDIQLIEFESLKIFPIFKDEEIVGTVVFYFDDDAKSFTCKKSDLLKLFNKLQESFNNKYDDLVNNAIVNSEDYIKLVYYKKGSQCYIDNFLKNKFHIKTNLVDLNDTQLKKKLDNEVKNKKYRYTSTSEFDIYYINKFDYAQKSFKFDLLAIQELENVKYDQFSLIYCDNVDLDSLLTNLFSENIIKKYFISNDLIAYSVDLEISNSHAKEILSKFQEKYLLILNTKKITSKMNLINLSNYINEVRPETFAFNDYVSYINKINNINLYSDVSMSQIVDKTFINSITKEVYGTLPSIANFEINTKYQRDSLVKAIYKHINSLMNNTIEGYIIPVLPSMLDSKRIFMALEKLQTIDKHLKVLITIPNIEKDNINGLEKGISKLRKQGLYVIVDSSVYFNNKTLYLLDLCNSIYIHQEEYEMLVKYPSGINTAIFQYMIKNYKELLIDYPLTKVTDAYFNTLLYYLK